VRGENVLLLGEVVCIVRSIYATQWPTILISYPRDEQDLDREDEIPTSVTKAPFEEVFELKKKEDSQRKAGDKKRHRELSALGFEPEHSGEILF
jgi:hypothetical protein